MELSGSTPSTAKVVEPTQVIGMFKSWTSLCLDVETADGQIVLLQVGNHKEQYLIDCRKDDPTLLLKYLAKSHKLIIGHNIKFDYSAIKKQYGVVFNNVWDTMLAAQVLECGMPSPKGQFTLESVVRRYVDPFAYTLQGDLFRPTVTKKVRETFTLYDEFTPEQLTYAALDVMYTYALYDVLGRLLMRDDLEKVLLLENEFSLVVADMTDNGIYLDKDE